MNNEILYTTIQLMKNNKVIHTINIEKITSYFFTFSNKTLATLSITVPFLNNEDVNILINDSYECYILMAKKKINDQLITIPARVYKTVSLVDNSKEIKLTFTELED